MAIKDWKKIESHPKDIRWQKGNTTIGIWLAYPAGWYFQRRSVVGKYFKTKSQALAFAKAYMRTH